MTIITVTRQSSALTREEWRFTYIDRDHRLKLTQYTKQERLTTRHKFRETVLYRAWDRRDSIHVSEIPRPADVFGEARDQFIETLSVGL